MLKQLSNAIAPHKDNEAKDEQERIMRLLTIELARGIREPEEILDSFNITAKEYEHLQQNRHFKRLLETAVKEWSVASNTPERVKLMSMALIEEALPSMFTELTNKDHPLSSRADLFGRIAKIGGLGNAPPPPTNTGEMFSIQINLGTEKPIVIHQDLPPRVTNGFEEYEDL